MTTSRKVGGDHAHLVPTFSKVRGDASHGSHMAVAPVDKAVLACNNCLLNDSQAL